MMTREAVKSEIDFVEERYLGHSNGDRDTNPHN